MPNQSFTCPNCRNDLSVGYEALDFPIGCGNCGAKVSVIPTHKKSMPEISANVRAAFIGILVVTAIIGALGGAMLRAGWNFWAAFALTGGIIYLLEKLFLSKYYLSKIDELEEGEVPEISGCPDDEKFNSLVKSALTELPGKFKDKLKDVNIVIEDFPNDAIIDKLHLKSKRVLAGLYQGIPLTQRSVWHSNRLPDKITIFKKNIESYCSSESTLKNEIKRVVRHELGHFFGLDERELREIEARKEKVENEDEK